MGLLDFLANLASDDKDKKIDDKLFEDEADALGLDEEEKKDAKESGILPEEWLEDD